MRCDGPGMGHGRGAGGVSMMIAGREGRGGKEGWIGITGGAREGHIGSNVLLVKEV